MFDRETDSLWSQFLSQAVDGPLRGTKLGFTSSLLTDWENWLSLYPETLVLDKGGGYRSDPYNSYYSSGATGIIPEKYKDSRLPTKELVMGLDVNGASKAYPLRELQDMPLVQETLGDTPVVIVFDPLSQAAAAYEANLDGQSITFALQNSPSDRHLFLVDEGTGTRWNAFSGKGVDGPLSQKSLRRIPSHYSFWFAWKDYHPGTLLLEG